MNSRSMKRVFLNTDFVHMSGTPEELEVAELLKAECESLGVSARLEGFRVAMAEMEHEAVYADGREIPCKGFFGCGSGSVEAELAYLPALDPVSLAAAKDKIVLLDQGVGFFSYHDLVKAGAKGLLFQYGNPYYSFRDIDRRDLREHVVGEELKLLCAMLNTADAIELVKNKVQRVRIEIRQREFDGQSHNVVAEIPGARDDPRSSSPSSAAPPMPKRWHASVSPSSPLPPPTPTLPTASVSRYAAAIPMSPSPTTFGAYSMPPR